MRVDHNREMLTEKCEGVGKDRILNCQCLGVWWLPVSFIIDGSPGFRPV